MKNLIKFVNNYTLFVEGATDRITAAQILEENTNQSPVGLMFAGAGVLSIKTGEHNLLNVPYRKVRLNDRNIIVRNMTLEEDGTMLQGMGIGLPGDVVRLQAAWDAARMGMPYNWDRFLDDYVKDLEEIGSFLLDHVDTARIDGLMAQAITDPRVGEDEVGLSITMAQKLHKALIAAGHTELKGVGHLDRLNVLLQGYPVVSPTGGRWVKLRILKGAPSNKVLVNAKTWKELHDRDEDGDQAFIGINSTASFGEVDDRVPAYPEIKMTHRDDLPEVKEADPVQTVMNMRARDLVGPQHSFFHGLARACAVQNMRRNGPEAFAKTYRGIFKVYHPMAEGVFDKRKSEGGDLAFAGLVKEMENHLNGDIVRAERFFPFLEDERLRNNLVNALAMVGGSTRIARGTVFGKLLMAGDAGREAALGSIIEALEKAGVAPEEMIRAMQEDALGIKIQPMDIPEPSDREPVKKTPLDFKTSADIKGMRDVFEKITLNGKPVLKVIDMIELTNGTMEVSLRVFPVWKPNSKCPMLMVQVPKISKVPGATEDGHRFLNVPGLSTRMFCPIFRMENGEVVEIRFSRWFSEMIAAGLKSFTNLRAKSKDVNQEKLQGHMTRHIRKAIRELVVINSSVPDEGIRETLIRMSEYRVEIQSKSEINQDRIKIRNGDTISKIMSEYEEILTALNAKGLDITTTSKNKPGTIVTKAWKHGIPRFIWAVNPFANLLDMKRKVEVREIRKALPLANPIPVPLKTKGVGLPDQFAQVLTTLNVAVMDLPGWNVFEGSDGPFCFDTLLVTASGIEKLRVKNLRFEAQDAEERDRIKAKLMADGVAEDQINIKENKETVDGGLSSVVYDIVVEGAFEDIGKIKAAVGPIKGVMNPVPFRVFACEEDGGPTEIDIIVPRDTFIRKRAVDAEQYMLNARNHEEEIDPDNQPVCPQYAREIMWDTTVYAVMADGTKVVLGETLTGPLPFFRPVQTGRGTTDIRTGEYGIKCQYHTMIMTGGVDFHNTPDWVSEDFAEIVRVRKEALNIKPNKSTARVTDGESAPIPTDDDVPVGV